MPPYLQPQPLRSLFLNSHYCIDVVLSRIVVSSNYLADPNLTYQEKWTDINTSLNQHRFMLFIILFIVIFIVNVGIIYSLLLKGTQIITAMKIVSISTIIIIGITSILINNITFVKIFENTIGFSIVKLFSPKQNVSFSTFINDLFEHSHYPNGGINFDFLFTAFRLDNFGDILKDIGNKNDNTDTNSKYDFYFNSSTNDELNQLARMVVMKNSIGHLSWMFFATIATTLISTKFLAKNL